MLKYFKESFKEFKHVNWPTRQETKLYLKIVVGVLTAFGIYLMIAGGVFTSIVFGLKNMVSPAQIENTTPIQDIIPELNLEGIETEGGSDLDVKIISDEASDETEVESNEDMVDNESSETEENQ